MTTTIKLPELGENVDSGELTKILVSPGETISKDQALLELETDKATIEVPSPVSGVIKELHVQEGRKVKVGDLLFTVEENGGAAKQKEKPQREMQAQRPPRAEEQPLGQPPSRTTTSASAQSAGAAAQPKKTAAGKRPEARAERESESTAPLKTEPEPEKREPPRVEQQPAVRAEAKSESPPREERDAGGEGEREETVIPFPAEAPEPARRPGHLAPASPSIRRLARELGVDINKVQGSGPEGRIDEQDVKAYAREIISHAGSGRFGAEAVPALPDFAKWGRIERKPMSNVRRATAEHLAQAWHNVPQVTQFDRADVTELESLRTRFSERHDSGGAFSRQNARYCFGVSMLRGIHYQED